MKLFFVFFIIVLSVILGAYFDYTNIINSPAFFWLLGSISGLISGFLFFQVLQ